MMTGKKHICATIEKMKQWHLALSNSVFDVFASSIVVVSYHTSQNVPPILALDWVSSLRKAAGGGRGWGKGEKKKRPSLSHRGDRRQSEKRKREEEEEATFFSLLVKS